MQVEGSLKFHKLHSEITSEAFARPSSEITKPARITRIAVSQSEVRTFHDLAFDHLQDLVKQMGSAPPKQSARHYTIQREDWRLIFERHTEFVSYTLIETGEISVEKAFENAAFSRLPDAWTTSLPGKIIAATQMLILPESKPNIETAVSLLGHRDFTAMSSSQRDIKVAADFRIDARGFTRMVLLDNCEDALFRGRLVQRLLEIDFYRLAALLALPVARGLAQKIKTAEDELTQLLKQMDEDKSSSNDDEILDRLTRLAGRLETFENETRFRFDAAKAYHQVVKERTDRLREVPINGHQRIGRFMGHRLDPAMRTCQSAQKRLQSLAERVARAVELFSTRVSVSIQSQNSERLRALNKRAELQLKLQQTVEGLSVIAISYYAVGLVRYALTALQSYISFDIVGMGTAISIPIAIISVHLFIQRIKSRIEAPQKPKAEKDKSL